MPDAATMEKIYESLPILQEILDFLKEQEADQRLIRALDDIIVGIEQSESERTADEASPRVRGLLWEKEVDLPPSKVVRKFVTGLPAEGGELPPQFNSRGGIRIRRP